MRAVALRVLIAAALLGASSGHVWSQGLAPSQSPPAQGQPPQQAQPPAQTSTGAKGQGQAGASSEPDKAKPRVRKSRRTPRAVRQPAVGASGMGARRVSRDAGPTRQELTLSGNLLGGYDDNVIGGFGAGAGAAPGPSAMASGSMGSADAALDYQRGNNRRSLSMHSTGTVVTYPTYLSGPAAGGSAQVAARTVVGRRLTLGVAQRAGYEPFFSVFSPGSSAAPVSPGIGQSVPATGLFERRSFSSGTSASIDRLWGRSNSTAVSYSYRLQRFAADDFGDNRAHQVAADYRRVLAPSVRLRAGYEHVRGEYTESQGAVRPTRQHRIEGGPELDVRLSRRRSLTLSLAAGASYFESLTARGEPYHEWVPVGSAAASMKVSSSWSVGGGYQRNFSELRGITNRVYATDTAFATAGGLVHRSVTLSAGATFSNWTTPVPSGVTETLNVYGASLQVIVPLNATVAVSSAYSYYYHRYSNPDGLPAGFPPQYDRSALRVGLTLRLPMIRTSPTAPPTPR